MKIDKAKREIFLECLKNAENGCPDDALRAAYYYDTGFGVAPCTETAHQWLERAARRGNIEARRMMIEMMMRAESEAKELLDATENNEGAESELFKAVLSRAEEGDVTSMLFVAKSYASGTLTKQCMKSAMMWLDKANNLQGNGKVLH